MCNHDYSCNILESKLKIKFPKFSRFIKETDEQKVRIRSNKYLQLKGIDFDVLHNEFKKIFSFTKHVFIFSRHLFEYLSQDEDTEEKETIKYLLNLVIIKTNNFSYSLKFA